MLTMDEQAQMMNIEETRVMAEPTETLEDISLDEDNPKKSTRIGADLEGKIKKDLIRFLRENIDVFTWSHEDMSGINPSVITHRLNVHPSSKPVQQKKIVFAPNRDNAIKEKVQKLTLAKFIQEVYYPDWLANVVMVKKENSKWRMYVNFTDLNKACPKDSYSPPCIDQLVDSTTGHRLVSFMDAFSRYNQIRMDKADQEKKSLVTSQGLFCYKVMPFGLKNAGTTYQRLVNHMFYPQIRRNVEVYVDDMLVKSQDEGEHLNDLHETFDTLRQYSMNLNPSKCAFGVSSGKFLSFMVSHMGIEANPDKIQVILDMEPPQSVKEVQSLTERVAALNRFVSKATDKCLPFFRVLKKAFKWTDDCQKASQDLKAYLTPAPLLSPSMLGEELYLYLAVTLHAVSSALVREEGRVQKPVRSERTIPTNREVGFYTDHNIKEVEALLPSSCHQHHDRPPAEESNEQVRGSRTINSMGCRAQ